MGEAWGGDAEGYDEAVLVAEGRYEGGRVRVVNLGDLNVRGEFGVRVGAGNCGDVDGGLGEEGGEDVGAYCAGGADYGDVAEAVGGLGGGHCGMCKVKLQVGAVSFECFELLYGCCLLLKLGPVSFLYPLESPLSFRNQRS